MTSEVAYKTFFSFSSHDASSGFSGVTTTGAISSISTSSTIVVFFLHNFSSWWYNYLAFSNGIGILKFPFNSLVVS